MRYHAFTLLVFCIALVTGCNEGTPQSKEGVNDQDLIAEEVSDCNMTEAPDPNNNTFASFENLQKRLFHSIDHNDVYQDCQEFMRLHREGKLSGTTFYGDDSETSQNELPESIRSLQSTYVRVNEIMVDISFSSGDKGTQSLSCFSNELGEPTSRGNNAKGLGFRSDPYSMDKLSGKESLSFLNENYNHFEMELIPGLTYNRFTEEQTVPPENVRQSNERMDTMMDFMMKTINELVVKKQRLLHRTNHHEFLKACRQVIVRYNEGVYSRAKINFGDPASEKDWKQIPQIILDFEPVYIWLKKDSVIVALIGGLDHAGVIAYMNDEKTAAGDDDFKLFDGLTYYDDGLTEASEDYKDYLDSLENEAIPYLDWKRKQMNLPIPKRTQYRK